MGYTTYTSIVRQVERREGSVQAYFERYSNTFLTSSRAHI